MRINVTQADIDAADDHINPVGVAVWLTLGDLAVFEDGVVRDNGRTWDCPPEVHRFVEDFRGGREVRPFSFDLVVAGG